MNIKILIINLVILSFLTGIRAQVSIGSIELPREGSLLDLKEEETTGNSANATKGLGLPRVELRSLMELTIDDASKANDYIGATVYNITNDENIKEGTYCWISNTWKQVIVAENKGSNEQILTSNGDGTYSWTDVDIPEISFYRPTQILSFDSNKKTDYTYSYSQIVSVPGVGNVYSPQPGLFDNNFVYSDNLSLMSDINGSKYMLLNTTIRVKKNTRGNASPINGTWEAMRVDIILNNGIGDQIIKSYETTYNVNAGGNTNTYMNFFSVISMDGWTKGDYNLKIRVSNTRNTFDYNKGNSNGNFSTTANPFYEIYLEDISLILYEYQ